MSGSGTNLQETVNAWRSAPQALLTAAYTKLGGSGLWRLCKLHRLTLLCTCPLTPAPADPFLPNSTGDRHSELFYYNCQGF